MRGLSLGLTAAAFVASYVLVAGGMEVVLGHATPPRPVADEAPYPLPTDELLDRLTGSVGWVADAVNGAGGGDAAPAPEDASREGLRSAIDILKNAAGGVVAIGAPDRMTLGETERVGVTLSMPAGIAQAFGGKGKPGPSGSAFDVELHGGKGFTVARGENSPGSFEFRVTPIEGGAHDLKASILVWDGTAFLPITEVSETVAVDVPFMARLRLLWDEHGPSLRNFVLVPLVVALLAAFGVRKLTSGKRPAPAKPEAESDLDEDDDPEDEPHR